MDEAFERKGQRLTAWHADPAEQATSLLMAFMILVALRSYHNNQGLQTERSCMVLHLEADAEGVWQALDGVAIDTSEAF